MTGQVTLQRKARVLFVGDDLTFETSVLPVLRAQSCEVFMATDRRKAWELSCVNEIDILVLDTDAQCKHLLQLPADLRAKNRHCCTLVISRSLDQLALASGVGVDGVLMKPVDLATMVTAVNNLLCPNSAQRPLPRHVTRSAALPSPRRRYLIVIGE